MLTQKIRDFLEVRQSEFRKNIDARMPGISYEQAQPMFDSAERALEKLKPTLDRLPSGAKDEATISALAEILGSRSLAE
jgi:hypothetical protein